MARRKTLTDSMIASLSPKPKPYTVADPELAGLNVRVQPTGTKKFLVIARNPNGKQKWITLGGADVYSIEEAREKAREAIKATREGKSLSGPETFESVANEWFKRHVEAKGIISGKNFRSAIDRHLMPSWEGRSFESIRRGDVSSVLDKVEDSAGPCAADFALSVTSMICNWYATRHDDYSSPIIKGMRRSNSKERARDRTLNDDELRQVWRTAEADGPFGAFIRVALLTGQRREKILAMRWEHIKDGEWCIPAEKREKGTAGCLVLPKMALDIINAQPRLESNPHVFPGRGDKYMGGESKRKADFDAKLKGVAHFTLHDLRRTARSLMSRAGVRPDIAERVLGHVQGGVLGIYDRHQYRDEKAHALNALAGLIETIINPNEKVVPIPRKVKQA
jgi:integrase